MILKTCFAGSRHQTSWAGREENWNRNEGQTRCCVFWRYTCNCTQYVAVLASYCNEACTRVKFSRNLLQRQPARDLTANAATPTPPSRRGPLGQSSLPLASSRPPLLGSHSVSPEDNSCHTVIQHTPSGPFLCYQFLYPCADRDLFTTFPSLSLLFFSFFHSRPIGLPDGLISRARPDLLLQATARLEIQNASSVNTTPIILQRQIILWWDY